MKPAEFKWGPLSVKQKKVLTWWRPGSGYSDYNGIIADGSIRSGKTVSMAFSFCLWAMTTFSRMNFGLCGKTVGSFRRNVLGTLKRQLRSRGYYVQERRAENLIVVSKNGNANSFYLFGGKDESSQDLIQGITLAGAFFDEVALMPESFVNQATARCSVDGSKWWFNCNPEGPFHWFYVKWILKCRKQKLVYLHFTMDDNLTLSEKIKRRYRARYHGVFFKRFVLGLWVIAEGLVYPQFNSKKHVTNSMPDHGLYYISIDYGTQNPCSMGLWCISDGVAYRVSEYYYNGRKEQEQKTDEEYYTALQQLAGDRVIQEVVVDPSAASFIAVIEKHRKYRVTKAENAVLDGIRTTDRLLNAGKIQIGKTCKAIIKEFGVYSWDGKKTEDAVIKENDHAMDDMRYFVFTILAGRFRW